MNPIDLALALGLLLVMYSTGFVGVSFFSRDHGPVFTAIMALPLGLGLWSVLWIAAVLFPLPHNFGFASTANQAAVALYVGIMVILLGVAVWQDFLNKANLTWWLVGAVILVLYSWLYFQFSGKTHLTGDSHLFINWAMDPFEQMQYGFPLISSSWTNLATLIGADQLLGVVYPLVGFSLAMLLYFAVFDFAPQKSPEDATPLHIIGMVTFLLTSILVFSEMFLVQMHYINNHSFMALVLLAIAFLLFLAPCLDWPHAMLIAFLVLLASMTRMEGFLYALMLVVMGVFARQDKAEGLRVLSASLLLAGPYLIFLSITFGDAGFIKGWQYLVMISGGVLAVLILATPLRQYFMAPRLHLLVLGFLLVATVLAIVIKPGHMFTSLYAFLYNTGNPKYWGLSSLGSLVLIAMLILVRYQRGQMWRQTDALLVWVLSAVLLSFVVTIFRSPLRVGIDDSVNRMLFHFLPILMVWLGVEITRALRPVHHAQS